jgi:hypothetical protein
VIDAEPSFADVTLCVVVGAFGACPARVNTTGTPTTGPLGAVVRIKVALAVMLSSKRTEAGADNAEKLVAASATVNEFDADEGAYGSMPANVAVY